MTRREFITGIGGAVVWPLAGHAQQIDRIRRIAIVSPAVPVGEMTIEARYAALFNELRKLGCVEGRNLIVERYSAVGRPERYGDLARDYEATHTHPDLIISNGNALLRSLQAATDTIPIVAAMADPVAFGQVASLARPGANLTGISVIAGLEICG